MGECGRGKLFITEFFLRIYDARKDSSSWGEIIVSSMSIWIGVWVSCSYVDQPDPSPLWSLVSHLGVTNSLVWFYGVGLLSFISLGIGNATFRLFSTFVSIISWVILCVSVIHVSSVFTPVTGIFFINIVVCSYSQHRLLVSMKVETHGFGLIQRKSSGMDRSR